jgi:polyisoprenoid-binding protein YceI
MKHFLALTTALMAIGSAGMAETYVLDPGHTEVRFYWNHAGLTRQSGEWTKVSGTIDFDGVDAANTKADIKIDAASLHTGVEELDTILSGADFFDVETYPTISFTSTSAVQTGANTMRLIGDLKIKDTTVEVALDVRRTFQGTHPLGGAIPYYEGTWLGAEASSVLFRTNHGVGLYAPLVSDEVLLEISTEMRAGGWPE